MASTLVDRLGVALGFVSAAAGIASFLIPNLDLQARIVIIAAPTVPFLGWLAYTNFSPVRFFKSGALRGEKFVQYVDRAESRILTVQIDDDPPGDKLQDGYARATIRGVPLERVAFLRPQTSERTRKFLEQERGRAPAGLVGQVWIEAGPEQGHWPNFMVIDGKYVLLSFPSLSFGPLPDEMVFSALVVIRNRAVAEHLERLHKEWMRRGTPVSSELDMVRVLRKLRLKYGFSADPKKMG
jgi:hypothetical protein